MTRFFACLGPAMAGLVLMLTAGFAVPAVAQQINPTAEAVKEQQLLREKWLGGIWPATEE